MAGKSGCESGNALTVEINLEQIEKLVKRFVFIEGDCWNWIGCINKKGYGTIRYKDKMVKAHRFFYAFFIKDIPPNKLVCHKCNNKKCVNPSHLYLGTHKENMIDRSTSNRTYKPRGSNNNNCKLTESQIIEIHKLWHNGIAYKEIGFIFNVSENTISSIVNNRNWSWLNLTWDKSIRKKSKAKLKKDKEC